MLTLAPFLEGYWPVRRFALSDLRFPRHLQPGAVFPEHVSYEALEVGSIILIIYDNRL